MTEPISEALKAYILKVKPELKQETNCNDELLDRMVAGDVFNSVDKQEVVSSLKYLKVLAFVLLSLTAIN